MPDISEPVRDRGHEALRLELLAAIEAGHGNAAGIDDTYFLTDILFDLLDGALAQVGELQTALTDLTERVTAMEPPVFDEPTP